MTANPYMGDVPVMIGEKEYVLRPIFEAMAEIETALDTRIRPLAHRFCVDLDFGARDVATIVLVGANAALRPGEKLKAADVQRAVAEQGLNSFAQACGAFLANCLRGGAPQREREPGEAKAAETE